MTDHQVRASSADLADGYWSDHEIVHIFYLYLYLEEAVDGFRWRVRAHEVAEPIDVGAPVFPTAETARAAGLAALDRVCAQVRANGYPRGLAVRRGSYPSR